MRLALAAALSLVAIAATPQRPAAKPVVGRETVISFAANGGLRDWQQGGKRSNILYVRDRTEQWYQVRLTGVCHFDLPLDTLSYTTDNTGTFDRFSNISLASQPGQVCGVASIRTSLPPPGHEGQGRNKVAP